MRELPQPGRGCPVKASGSAQQLHPEPARAPLRRLRPPKKQPGTPPLPSEVGLARPKPTQGLLPGHHTYLCRVGRAGGAPAPTGSQGGSQPCSARESLILHQGQQAKNSALLFPWGKGREEGTHSGWNTGLNFLPVLRFIYLSIYYSLYGELYPCHWDKTWIWDQFGLPKLL